MTTAPRPDPIGRFLGPDAAGAGPFGLLGISPASCNDATIISGLDHRLARLASHPECDTPEADEVRLALHAAAAQLLDPRVRQRLTQAWLESGEEPAALVSDPAPADTRSAAEIGLEHDAVLTLGMAGGWNAESIRRVISLAHARGLTSADVARVLHRLESTRRGGGPAAARPPSGISEQVAGPAPSPRTRPQLAPIPLAPSIQSEAAPSAGHVDAAGQTDPTSVGRESGARLLRLAVASAAVVLVAIAATVVGIVLSRRGPSGMTPPAPVPVQSPPVAGPSPPPTAPDQGPPTAAPDSEPPRVAVRDSTDPAGAVRDLADCVRGLEISVGEALAAFGRAIGTIGAGWTGLAPDVLASGQNSVVEFVYRASASGVGAEAVGLIGAGAAALRSGPSDAAEVRAAAWSMGVLARLSRDRDLPATAQAAIRAAFDTALGVSRASIDPSFEAGAMVAARAMPARLIGRMRDGVSPDEATELWGAWIETARALSRGDDALRNRILAAGLLDLLADGPEATESQAAFRVVRQVVGAMTWRTTDETRAWALRLFDDARVSGADLHALTSALATASAASGVDVTMVLPVLASDRVRGELRSRYARAWGLAAGSDRSAVIEALAARAAEAESALGGAAHPVDRLAAALVMSQLNEVAELVWRGRADEATALLATVEIEIPTHDSGDPAVTSHGDTAIPTGPGARRSPGSAWAEDYLAAKRNIPIRLELLSRLSQQGGPREPVDAEVLMDEALRGSPSEVRRQAQDMVRTFARLGVIANAALEALPTMPLSASNGGLIAHVAAAPLPPISDPTWRLAARRALVERVLEAVATGGDLAEIDRLTDRLAVSYASRAASQPWTKEEREQFRPPQADASAAQIWRRLRDGIDRGAFSAELGADLDRVERLRAGRLGLADGPVQRFAAQQVCVAELLGIVVAIDRPDASDRVGRSIAAMTESRRSANHVLVQLHEVEKAILELWLARLGEESPWPTD